MEMMITESADNEVLVVSVISLKLFVVFGTLFASLRNGKQPLKVLTVKVRAISVAAPKIIFSSLFLPLVYLLKSIISNIAPQFKYFIKKKKEHIDKSANLV